MLLGNQILVQVAGQLIKNVADTADKLMDLQKKLKDVNKEEKGSTPTNVSNNAVFLGSTPRIGGPTFIDLRRFGGSVRPRVLVSFPRTRQCDAMSIRQHRFSSRAGRQ